MVMKKAIVAVLCMILIAVGLTFCRSNTREKNPEREEFKQMEQDFNDSMNRINDGLKNLPKIED